MSAPKNRGGRPRLNPVEGIRRIPLGLRVTPRLHAAILTAAQTNGRSISQEVEFALELAFGNADEVIARIKKSREIVGVVEASQPMKKGAGGRA